MSTFSRATFKSFEYDAFRPHYPRSFYRILGDYVQSKGTKVPVPRAIDLGCGTGKATYLLLDISQKVTGLDPSTNMIKTARSSIDKNIEAYGEGARGRVEFEIGNAEDFLYGDSSKAHKGSYDLITVAQAIHWFKDFNLFFKSSYELLRPGGTIAYWYYLDPVVVDFRGPAKGIPKEQSLKKAREIYNKYIYDDNRYMGPHWEYPGRGIIRDKLEVVNKAIPKELFNRIVINAFEPYETKKHPSTNDLSIEKLDSTLEQFVGYLRTYSNYRAFVDATDGKVDVIKLFLEELETELGWTSDTKFDVVWNTGYTFVSKK